MPITHITKTDADRAKHERLALLKREYEELSLEGLALIDAWKLEDVEEVINRRREVNKRMEELAECLK